MAYAVDAGRVFFALRCVTGPAIDRFGSDIVIGMFGSEVGMATGARIGFVSGSQEPGPVNKQGKRLSGGIGFEKGLVGMTFQAGVVANGSHSNGGRVGRIRNAGTPKKGGAQEESNSDAMRLPNAHAKNIGAQQDSDSTCLGQRLTLVDHQFWPRDGQNRWSGLAPPGARAPLWSKVYLTCRFVFFREVSFDMAVKV
jgi:hypothetical protein